MLRLDIAEHCCEQALRNPGFSLQGSSNDLQLLILLNLTIIFIGTVLRHFIITRNLPSGGEPSFGQDVYRVSLSCNKSPLIQP